MRDNIFIFWVVGDCCFWEVEVVFVVYVDVMFVEYN